MFISAHVFIWFLYDRLISLFIKATAVIGYNYHYITMISYSTIRLEPFSACIRILHLSRLAKNYNGKGNLRIDIFNDKKWKFPPISSIDPPFSHFSVTDFIALDNPRIIPQQALTTVTNVENIEVYLLEKEKHTEECFIEAIDILAVDRELAMKELRYMGISAGSMLPLRV